MLSTKFTALALWISLATLFFDLDPRLYALAFAALLVAIGFRCYGIIRRHRAKWLMQHGIKVDAVVTGVEESKGLKIDGRRPWYVTCKGRTPSEFAGVTFRSQGLWNYGAGSPHPGETVWVYVDRADSSRYFVMAIQPGMTVLTGSSLVTLIARYSIPLGIALFIFWTPNETWAAARQALYDHLFPSSLAGTLRIGQPIIDIPAHALFLAANHRFLLLVAAVGAVFVVPKKLTAFIWLFVLLNIFVGAYVSSFVLDTIGVTGRAQVTSTYDTSSMYNNRNVVGFNVQIKTADGVIVDTSFEDDDFNQYPFSNTFVDPSPGDQFNVRYLPTFPKDFVIITNDDSPWARHLACGPLEQKLFAAERKYEFADHAPAYRAPYIDAIEAAIAGGCFDGNPDLRQVYRDKITEVKAGRD